MIPVTLKKRWVSFAEGRLSASETLDFVRQLKRNPRLARLVLDDLDFDAELAMILGKSDKEVAEEVLGKIARVRSGTEGETAVRFSHRRAGRKTARWPLVWGLAMAASLLVAVGLFFFARPDGEFRAIRQIGAVSVSDSGVATGPDGAALIEFRDGTVVALDRETRLHFAQASGQETRNWQLETGKAYLDKPPDALPLTVQAGEARIHVTGTRLLLFREGVMTGAAVLQGSIRMDHGITSTRIQAGQNAVALISVPEQTRIIVVRNAIVDPDMLAWIRPLGVPEPPLPPFPPPLAVSECKTTPDNHAMWFFMGDWTIDSGSGRTVICLDADSGERGSTFFLPLATWSKATLSYRFRINEFLEPIYNIGPAVLTPANGHHQVFALGSQAASWLTRNQGVWVTATHVFERLPDERIGMRSVLLRDNMPGMEGGAVSDEAFELHHKMKLGITAFGCLPELTDIRFRYE